MNNFEKIKEMNIDELAKRLYQLTACKHCEINSECKSHHRGRNKCVNMYKQWLLKEVEND